MLEFRKQGIFCKPGDFYIDPWLPVSSALITHGHADHARWGMKKYLCHDYTLPILKSRISMDINAQGIGYGKTIVINGVQVSFHPAGHIIGSAQIRMEYKGKVVVVSGDYKLQDDGLSTPFEPLKCHEFVSESTFGLPIYNWQSTHHLNEQLRQWVTDNQASGKTSVFFGYSLGKAQRIMKAMDGIGKIYIHPSIEKINEAFSSVGIDLPSVEVMDSRQQINALNQSIIILPPALIDSALIGKIKNRATAYCSGWMQVRGARRWRSADAGFAMSDHADWKGLLEAIKATEAEKIYVTHGQTAAFAKYLNEIGLNAFELKTQYGEEEEQ